MLKKLFEAASLLMMGILIFTNFLSINLFAAPFFNSITPTNGPDTGGTNVTINASGLRDYTETAISIPNATGSTIASQGFHFRIDTTSLAPTTTCRDNIRWYNDTGSTLEVIFIGSCGSAETLYVVQVPNIPVGGKTITMRAGSTISGFSYIAPGSANYPFYRSWLDSDTANNAAAHYGMDVDGDSDGNIYVLYSRQAAQNSSILIFNLVKFDPDTGNRIWTREMRRNFAGTGGHQIRMQKFRVDSNDNIVIPGRFFQQGVFEFEDTAGFQTLDNQTNLHPGFAVIYDKNGNIVNLSTNLFSSSSSDIDEVELDSAGNIYVSAYISPQDYITKLNPAGDTVLWSVPINPAGGSENESMIAHSDGFIYTVSDKLVKKLDSANGSEVWSKTFTGGSFALRSISENPDGTILLSGRGISSGPYTASIDALSETSTIPLGINDTFFSTFDQAGNFANISFLGRDFGIGDGDLNQGNIIRDNAGSVYSAGGDKYTQAGVYLGRLHGYVEDPVDSWFDLDDSFVTTTGGHFDTRGLDIEEIDTGGADRYRYTVRFPMNPPSQSTPVSNTSYATFDGIPCTNVVIVSTSSMTCDTPAHAPGLVDVEAINPGQAATVNSVATDAYTYDFSGTTIAPANYGNADCTPDPSTIGVDTVTCLIDLTGDANNNYALPNTGITSNLRGLGAGDACTIINNSTPTAQLSCSNIPTTGGVVGPIDALLDDTTAATVIDTIQLVDVVNDSDGDGVDDVQENSDGTSPTDPTDYQDTDGDFVPDAVETDQGTNPNDENSFLDDDNGGIPNYVEDTLIPNVGGSSLNTTNSGDDIDPDNDGVTAEIEKQAFNSGDGNNDGIPDFIQASVASAPNPFNNNNYLTMETSVCSDVNELSFIQESDNANQDQEFDYPYGLHKFEIQCTTPGSTATVKFYWDAQYDTTDWVYRKYDNNGYFNFPDVVIGQESINGTLVTTSTMTITDGGVFDLDGQVNGTIIDPAGPTLPEGDSLIGDLIRSGGNYTNKFNHLQAASMLVFMAAGLTMIISVKLKEK